VRCGKTLVVHDNRVQRRYIKTLIIIRSAIRERVIYRIQGGLSLCYSDEKVYINRENRKTFWKVFFELQSCIWKHVFDKNSTVQDRNSRKPVNYEIRFISNRSHPMHSAFTWKGRKVVKLHILHCFTTCKICIYIACKIIAFRQVAPKTKKNRRRFLFKAKRNGLSSAIKS